VNPDLPRTDSLVLQSDGAPPSPQSSTGFIPTSDGPASYSTFSKNVKEANSRREVEKRLAEIAAEADRRANEAQTEKVYHSTQLKEYIFNPARIAPLDVARKDY
jgi:hypothetical protein